MLLFFYKNLFFWGILVCLRIKPSSFCLSFSHRFHNFQEEKQDISLGIIGFNLIISIINNSLFPTGFWSYNFGLGILNEKKVFMYNCSQLTNLKDPGWNSRRKKGSQHWQEDSWKQNKVLSIGQSRVYNIENNEKKENAGRWSDSW